MTHAGPPVKGTEWFWWDEKRSAENWELTHLHQKRWALFWGLLFSAKVFATSLAFNCTCWCMLQTQHEAQTALSSHLQKNVALSLSSKQHLIVTEALHSILKNPKSTHIYLTHFADVSYKGLQNPQLSNRSKEQCRQLLSGWVQGVIRTLKAKSQWQRHHNDHVN